MSDTGSAALREKGHTPGSSAEPPALADAIRDYFLEDRSRMTMSAARKFLVPEREVLEALVGHWPITRLRDDVFRELMEALPDLGPVRVFVRSRAAVIEAVGTFGGFSESGPFFNVQTDTLDMHILPAEVAALYAVEKVGHDSTINTYSLQFFDHDGAAAFKVFLWDGYPDVAAHRVEAFHNLTRRFARSNASTAPGNEIADAARLAPAVEDVGPGPEPANPSASESETGPEPRPEAAISAQEPTLAPMIEADPEPDRMPIPLPTGVIPGSFEVGQMILGHQTAQAPAKRVHVPRRVRLLRYAVRGCLALASVVVLYLLTVNVAVPYFWQHYESYPRLTDAPKTALTERNGASNPLNVALLGEEEPLILAVLEAGWTPADPATFQTGNRYAREKLKTLPFPRATLPDLFLFGRRQDLIFERLGGKESRHSLRLWRSTEFGRAGQPLWIGSTALDRAGRAGRVGHHIAPDVDTERDAFINGLSRALRLIEVCQVTGVGPTFSSRTVEGDLYYTDGELAIGTLTMKGPHDHAPEVVASPLPVRIKDWLWSELKPLLGAEGS